ncbi:MAG: hypothetical protein N3A62_00135 [Thermodesulfovibrionales bacterium]|nr:hypothetical protein [Thermodesulfovibrionales bacterium]
MPHLDAVEACELVVSSFDIPFWPQLPKVSYRESMIAQFAEGMPNVIFDDEHQTIYAQRDEDQLSDFYASYSEDMTIPMSEGHAKGLHQLIKSFSGKRFDYIKGQIAGPLTFTLSLKDKNGRYIYFDEELREIALMTLKAKILWQIDVLKGLSDNVIFFIDEPIFTAIGSTTYLGVNEDEIIRLISECVEAVRNRGAMSGIHCCGRSDWGLVIKTGVDMLSFDAYEYFDTFSLYKDDVKEFIKRGGYLFWGIVPTSELIKDISYKDVLARWQHNIDVLSKDIDRDTLLHHSLLTPSCGMGSRDILEVKKILEIQKNLKEDLVKEP